MSMFVRRREAAEMLGVSTKTLARWHEAGLLRSRRVGPRLMVYDLEDLHRFARGGVVADVARVEVTDKVTGAVREVER